MFMVSPLCGVAWGFNCIRHYQARIGTAIAACDLTSTFSLCSMEVDHDSATPPYLQVADELRRRIMTGELPPGGRVPSITYLMQEFGVARNTARRAIEVLTDEGLVTVRQGWGTFVSLGEA